MRSIKKNAHYVEKEYRLTFLVDKEKIEYRNSSGLITPFVILKMAKMPLHSIWIAPIINDKIAKTGVRNFLRKYGYINDNSLSNTIVENSEIKLRK